MSSYAKLNEPPNGPPLYSGVAIPAAEGGYQMNNYSPNPGVTATHIPPGNSGETGRGGAGIPYGRREPEDEEDKTALGESDFYEPASIPVQHLNLDFKKCFHEHPSTQTFPILYKAMDVIYRYTKLIVYHLFVVLFGFIFIFFFAIINGITAFVHVWIYGPLAKFILLWMYAFMPLITEPLRAFLTPLVDVSARIFRKIRIQANVTGPFADALAARRSNV